MRHLPTPLCACLLLACSDAKKLPQDPVKSPAQIAPLTLEHDFGVVPHGESREHEFVIDLAALGEPFVPLRVHLDCQCGHADLRLRDRAGNERFVDGLPTKNNMPADGEQLILHVVVDTSRLEAADLPSAPHKGFVVLQSTSDMQGTMRVPWPIQLRFAVDAPVELRPFTALDFGRVALSQAGEVMTTLRGDDNHRDLQFGPVQCEDPELDVTLTKGDPNVLRLRCQPKELGNHRAVLSIGTTLPGYTVRLQATWKVVPDLEAAPLAKISFHANLAAAQPDSAASSQFVLVTDHDRRRSAEFTVLQIVGADGRDVTDCFATKLEPVPGQTRQQRLSVRYTGGLTDALRATLQLTKHGTDGPFLPIELVVFPAKDP